MALELKQQLKLSQQLLMTPQLQQAIKLLQLSRLELVDTVQHELMENPFLEEGEDSPLESRGGVDAVAGAESSERHEEHDAYDKDIAGSADWEDYLGDLSSAPKLASSREYELSEEISSLEDEVKLHDPWIALDGKTDGLYFYRLIVKESVKHIKKGGYLLFETGFDQGKDVSVLLEEQGYEEIQVKKDLAGLDRVVMGRYNKE